MQGNTAEGRDEPTGGYLPLSAYGLIGNLETCALVGRSGSIDWCPLPHLESGSVFAAVLDAERGGRFRIGPVGPAGAEQEYLPGTNVLRTTFEGAAGSVAVTDFMPVEDGGPAETAIYRKLTGLSGSVDVEVEFDPRFDYARAERKVEAVEGGVRARTPGKRSEPSDEVFLSSPVGMDVADDGRASAAFAVEAGEEFWFVLRYDEHESVDAGACDDRLATTADFWRSWAHTCDGECPFEGEWHDQVVRSGLALKLLTHHETGAIAAAPTTSLPERIGGLRNWDYRYNWIRDAAFTIQALANLGHLAEADAYVDWFMDRCETERPASMQPLYGLHGRRDLAEVELTHLSGYRNSAPVRVGNAAADQRQLDIYGELVLAIAETSKNRDVLSEADWASIRDIVDYVADVWEKRDAGIWEVRGEPRHFVHSKVMCWVALDRGLLMADGHGFDAPTERWRETRDEIKRTVIEKGYDAERNTFTRSFGESNLDATGLLLPVVGFLPADDDRVQGTIDAIQRNLSADDGLVRRYDDGDGLPGEEGAFVICSFWLVDALALSGRVEEARDRFADLLAYASPLGLLSEEMDPATGEQLGNTPQAFSHIGLINAALYLGEAGDGERADHEPMGVGPAASADGN